MTIIKEDCYGLFAPSSGKDEVNSMVSVDVSRLDHEAACWRYKLNCLPPGCRELEVDPVVSRGGPDLAALDTGEIGTLVPVEIGNRERRARSHRSNRRTPYICSGCRCRDAWAKKAK